MFSSAPPPGGKKIPHWSYERVNPGEVIKGWLAGPMVGVVVHWDGRTVPCLTAMTNGHLECTGCLGKKKADWLGYVPIYTETATQAVVGVKEDAAEVVANLKLHTPIIVSRRKAKTFPIVVRAEMWTTYPPSSRPERQVPRDIKEWLLQLWKLPALTAWAEKWTATAAQYPRGGVTLTPPVAEREEVHPAVDKADARAKLREALKKIDVDTPSPKMPSHLNGTGKKRKGAE